MTVNDLETGRRLRLNHSSVGPCVKWQVSGEEGNIVFQVLISPAPALMFSLSGMPMAGTEDAVQELMFRRVNG
jgi:hypothetical protein